MKNTSRQETASTSHPPMNGPMALATPASPAQALIATGRSSARKLADRMARLPGTSSAPPRPCKRAGRDERAGFGASAAQQ